ncbi:MAG: universal stress protein [Planctomycetota bacterium]
MVGSESDDLGREVDASMRMFQKSQTGDAPALRPIRPARVLVALDGSTQDATSIAAAKSLRERFNVESLLLDARQGEAAESGDDLTTPIVNEVSGARPIERESGDSYEMILSALQKHQVDLLIVPCPFQRDFDNVGTDSAGTVIDVLLSRCPVPLLVIRRPDQSIQDCCQTVSVVLGAECDAENKAAAWAFGLSADHGTVTLNLVVEKEQYENIRSIVEAVSGPGSLDADAFTEALTKTHQSLHGAMAKTATELGKSYHLRPQAGEIAPPNPLHSQDKVLLVLPLEVDDRFGQGFAQDKIRRSPHPVLVVPSHVPSPGAE